MVVQMSVRQLILCLVLVFALPGAACTSDDPPVVRGPSPAASASIEEVPIAAGGMTIPDAWSFLVARRPKDFWSFQLVARHGFNLGVDYCEPDIGVLGGLLKFEKAIVIGTAGPSDHDPIFHGDDPPQTAGALHLDPESMRLREGTGCRKMYNLWFQSNGYTFTLEVALSKDAGPAIRREVMDVLNSLH